MTELRSDWLIGYYALGRDKFSANTISINKFSSERVDSKGLCGSWRLRVMAPGNNYYFFSFFYLRKKWVVGGLYFILRKLERRDT